jgi:hypothetical protein
VRVWIGDGLVESEEISEEVKVGRLRNLKNSGSSLLHVSFLGWDRKGLAIYLTAFTGLA